ncbi:MAG: hypothetical protein GYB65_22155 [Chloroflexi bacterium]|nr:hypothetical protein [Chloroflexota bacterium]
MVKKVSLVVLVVVLGALGVASVSADGGGQTELIYVEDYGWVPAFTDGRLNSTHMDAPVAVYYHYTAQQLVNDDGEAYIGDVLSGISVWYVNPETAVGEMVIYADSADISAALNAGTDVQIAANGGITLNYSADGAFWVSAGAYSFSWDA